MTEPVTPKADRRVLDGEVVDEQASAEQKNGSSDRGRKGKTSKPVSKGSLWARPWVRKGALWSGSLLVIVATLYATRPDTDWQVDHINRLQTQVAQLHQTNQQLLEKLEQQKQALEQQIDHKIDQALAERLKQPENQPLVTKEDLDQLKKRAQARADQLNQQLEARLQSIQESLEARWKTLSEKLAESGQRLQPSEEEWASLKELETRFQGELGRIGQELESLLNFKEELGADAPQTERQTDDSPAGLNRLQIQQWMVEINADWLIKGQAEQTKQQLLALEQALGLSDVPNKTELARRIGQDLNQVERYAKARSQAGQQVQKRITQLRSLVAQLPVRPASGTSAEPAEPTPGTEPLSTLDRFLDRLSGLVSIQKRGSEQDLTQVESLLMHDVLIQRATLLVDRIDWALTVGSEADAQAAVASLRTFIAKQFPSQQAAFAEVLDPIKRLSSSSRQPLSIIEMSAASNTQDSAS